MPATELISTALSGVAFLQNGAPVGAPSLGAFHAAMLHATSGYSGITTFGAIGDFSRTHCLAICAVLVPANLLATLQTLIFVGFDRPRPAVRLITSFASFYATVMLLHVLTWFVVGVVMVPTFILTGLGCFCLTINVWAIVHPQSLCRLLNGFARRVLSLAPARLWAASTMSEQS